MNRAEYLKNPDIKNFIDYLVASFDTDCFSHSWVSYDKKSTGIKVGERWHCSGIKGAIENYYWPSKDPVSGDKITSLKDTEELLGNLAAEMHDAMLVNDSAAARMVCRKILRWGGVEDKPKVAPDIKNEQVDLLGLLNRVSSQCQLGSFDLTNLQVDGKPWLRIDSGTTKVFSLLVPGFAMLDSRVGCALALLVSKFWQNSGRHLSTLPSILRFSWGGHASSRNPNPGAHGQAVFPKLENSGVVRAQQNFQVSWLLGAVAKKLEDHAFFRNKVPIQIVRELEAGLFMIGYGVAESQRVPGKKEAKHIGSAPASKKEVARRLFEASAEAPLSRGAFIKQCTKAGINPNTASTYFAELTRIAKDVA